MFSMPALRCMGKMRMYEVLVFTQSVHELLDCDIPIRNVLNIISTRKSLSRIIRNAAQEIETSLQEGTSLSLALMNCNALHFDSQYISFIRSAECSGTLKPTLGFLVSYMLQKQKLRNEMALAMIYPLLVVVASLAGSVALVMNAKRIFFSVSGDPSVAVSSQLLLVVRDTIVMFLCVLAVVVASVIFVGNGEKQSVIRGLYFLSKSGMSVKESLPIAFSLVQKDYRLKRKMVELIDSLDSGADVVQAFSRLDDRCSMYLDLCSFRGDMSRAFEQMVQFYEEKRRKKEKFFLQCIEPVTMGILALYIILLLKDVVMPVMFNYGL